MSTDRELNTHDRKAVIAKSRRLSHESALVKWALDQHATYNSRFSFQSQTDNRELDEQIERIVAQWSKSGNFEVTGRHSLAEFMRLAEICRTIDGDIGIMKLTDGRVQALESDRIRTPNDIDSDPEWTHGVKTDKAGAAIAYAVHTRGRWGDYQMERIVPAEHLILHGYYSRFDQIRGVGLLVSAVDCFTDIGEAFNYALAKSKLMQLFGLTFTQDPEKQERCSKDEEEAKAKMRENRRLALRDKASYMVELEPGEEIKPVESAQPSSEFQEYTKMMMMVALKSLGICYSMFDEKHTNFYGSRAAINQYVELCKPRRASNQHLLDHLTRWRLSKEVLSGRLILPDGMTVNDLWFEWAPAGMPWWKPDEEAKGFISIISGGLDSPRGICHSLGRDFKDIVDETAQDIEYAKSKGVHYAWMNENTNLNIGT
jgi:capsid protein